MKNPDKRSYRPKGLEFSNLVFSSKAEREYVQEHVKRVAEKIKALRLAQKLSQEALAEKCSVSLSMIKFIEQGQRSPSLPLLLKVIYVLDRKISIWK